MSVEFPRTASDAGNNWSESSRRLDFEEPSSTKDVRTTQEELVTTGERTRPNFTEVSRRLKNAERGLKTFWKFLKPYRGLVVCAFLLGLALSFLSDLLLVSREADHASWTMTFKWLVTHTLGHIATGLTVSSICVFGFEYLSKARGDFERTEKMEGLAKSLDDAVKTLGAIEQSQSSFEEIRTVLYELRSKVSEENSRKVAYHCFSNTNAERTLGKSLNGIIRYASELKRTHSVDSQYYLEFLGWLCNVILRNAQSLAALEEDIAHGSFGGEIEAEEAECKYATLTISWPSSQEVAARISATKMKGLRAGDSFCAVSNVLFWDKGQMDFFLRETEIACKERGVNVRRIFNLCNMLYVPGLLEQNFDAAKQIVKQHQKLQQESNGKYEVRFYGPEQVAKAFKANKTLNPQSLSYTSFAIFKRADNEPDIVRYRIEDESLSRMSLSRADVHKYSSRFEAMWQGCEGVPNPFEGDVEEFKKTMGTPR